MQIWLITSIASLAIAGVLALILVLSRTPILQNFFASYQFFKPALVAHVNLSVLVWLSSICALFWVTITSDKLLFIAKVSAMISLLGMICIALSPFTGKGEALMNNYVPILTNLTFLLGLSFFAAGYCCKQSQLFLALIIVKLGLSSFRF